MNLCIITSDGWWFEAAVIYSLLFNCSFYWIKAYCGWKMFY